MQKPNGDDAMECNTCNHPLEESANFCHNCGDAVKKELPYIGESKGRGIYRITFEPVEGEFDYDDAAWDAVRHAAWNEDTEFGKAKVEFVKSTVTTDKYPYECGECHEYVSDHTDGKCSGCGCISWVPRDD